jgi:hypothetical protein
MYSLQPGLNGALFLKKQLLVDADDFSEKSGSGRRIKLP